MQRLAVVTCGPAYEPIDAVRRITNMSSGEMGAILSTKLEAAGFRVACFCGEMATHPPKAKFTKFSTNASLLTALKRLKGEPDVIFHAAALSDFIVADIVGAPRGGKIRSDAAQLFLNLRPAPKVLPELSKIFPKARVVGWKYEVDGRQADAVKRGKTQLEAAGGAACVVNGPAYGDGFGFLKPGGRKPEHFADKDELCEFLAEWARRAKKK